jgi:hypothetical protein
MFASIDTDGSGDLTLDELIPVVFPKARPPDAKAIKNFVLDKFARKPAALAAKKEYSASQLEDLRSLFKVRALGRHRHGPAVAMAPWQLRACCRCARFLAALLLCCCCCW